MLQEKYSFPLPNDGDGYKLTKNELIELLDAAYESGVKAVTPTSSTMTYSSNQVCGRCGKIIPETEVAIKTMIPGLDGNVDYGFWCEACYNKFVDDLNKPVKSFTDVKPAKYVDYSKKVKSWIDAAENRNK